MNFFFSSQIVQQREKYALSRKKKVYFISPVKLFSFLENSFLLASVITFNQKKRFQNSLLETLF